MIVRFKDCFVLLVAFPFVHCFRVVFVFVKVKGLLPVFLNVVVFNFLVFFM